MIYLYIYLVIGVVHGFWAIKMQMKHHPNAVEYWRLLLVFLINSIGWPITMPWAAVNKQLW